MNVAMKKTIASAAVFCLVCLCAAPVPALADSLPAYRYSYIFLTTRDTPENPQTVSFEFVNSFFNDLTEFHTFFLFTMGAGTVNLSIETASFADVQYGIAGLIGLMPVAGYGIYGTPIEVGPVTVPLFSIGVLFMASLKAAEPLLGVGYPVTMSMKASLSQ
jgi:hypothetical protein